MFPEVKRFIADILVAAVVAFIGGIAFINPIVTHFVNHILR